MDPVTMALASVVPMMFDSVLPVLGSSLSSLGSSALSLGKDLFNGIDDFFGTNVGNALGSFGMNSGLGAISSAINYKYNKKLQDRAFAHQIKMYKNQNQWRVQDLRKAGLNPILSTHAASSMPTAPMGNVSTSMGHHDLSQSFLNLQGFKNKRDFQRYARENHDVDLAKSEAQLHNMLLQNQYVMSQIRNLEVNTSRQMYDLDFISQSDYEELRRLDLLHRVFPIDGDIGFNVGKGKKGKGFGLNLNLGDGYNAYGRSHYYRSMGNSSNGSSALQIRKNNDEPYVSTNYKPKFHNFGK